ncbi:MAG TPA: hypothetical protein VL096_06400 [Pirellulaceae bacterium]|nr:hypothetical protein [Pirellulaceae bacterium]
MIGKLLGAIPSALLYFCLATVLVQVGAIGVLSAQGLLTQEKIFQCLAAFYGVNLHEIEEKANAANAPPPDEQPAFEEVIKKRALASRDLVLREAAIDKALVDVRALTAQLKTERERYDQLKQQFDARLAQLEQVFTDTSLQEVQRTLEVMQPKQAKDQILRMLEEVTEAEKEKVNRDVVTMLKAMPLDKRKKIVSEFKTPEEAEKLHDILKQIREGVPDTTLIRETRAQLAAFSPQGPRPQR